MSRFSINLYDKDNNFIAQYPNLSSYHLAVRNSEHFIVYFNEVCECNNYKYTKGYTCKDVKIVSIIKEGK